MFDAFKNEMNDAARGAIAQMPPSEVQTHAQTLMAGMRGDAQDDLAKELEEVVRAAAADPHALSQGLLAFVQRHPETVEKYAPNLAGIIGR